MRYRQAAERIGVACALVALAALGISCGPKNEPATPQGVGSALVLTSSSFANGRPIPAKHARASAGGQDVSPALSWIGVPENAKSLALVCIDRNKVANDWVHWIVVDIPPDATGLGEGASDSSMPSGSRELLNTFGQKGWGGPSPPSGTGVHVYEFVLYALDTDRLDLPAKATLDEFEQAVSTHTIEIASLSGTFAR